MEVWELDQQFVEGEKWIKRVTSSLEQKDHKQALGYCQLTEGHFDDYSVNQEQQHFSGSSSFSFVSSPQQQQQQQQQQQRSVTTTATATVPATSSTATAAICWR